MIDVNGQQEPPTYLSGKHSSSIDDVIVSPKCL